MCEECLMIPQLKKGINDLEETIKDKKTKIN